MRYEVDEYVIEHLQETDKYYIYFKDSAGKDCKLEIKKEIFDTYIESRKNYIKIKNQKTRYEEQSEQTEISLSTKAFYKQASMEDSIIRNAELEKLKKAKETLTDTQRKRIELHIENGITLNKIAEIEGVRKNKIDKSIAQGMKKLKKFFKDGGQDS